MNFKDFNFKPELLKGITEQGYTSPTPIQEQTIPLLLNHKDVIGCAQTGTGKTAAFALPILEKVTPNQKHPQAVILTPTRELAEQIYQNIKGYSKHIKGLNCLAVYGGVKIQPQITRLNKGVDILIATPGRLMDHLRQKNVTLEQIQFFVLDEADRMLDMGFLPDIQHLMKYIPKERQSLLFSATMPPEIEGLAHDLTHNAETIMVAPRNTAAESVEQSVFHVLKRDKMRLLIYLFKTKDLDSTIVFSRTKHGADRIAQRLQRKGFNATTIHSDRSQSQRQAALNGFQDGKYDVLVATDIAARGIDIQGISHVINYDTPEYAEDYVHRIGRTGRADATGEAWTFSTPEDEKYLSNIERMLGNHIPVAPTVYLPDEDQYDHRPVQRERKDSKPRKRFDKKAAEAKSSSIKTKIKVSSKKSVSEDDSSKTSTKKSSKTRTRSESAKSQKTESRSNKTAAKTEQSKRIKIKASSSSSGKTESKKIEIRKSTSKSSDKPTRTSLKSGKSSRTTKVSSKATQRSSSENYTKQSAKTARSTGSKKQEKGPITLASVDAIPLYIMPPKHTPQQAAAILRDGVFYLEDNGTQTQESPKPRKSRNTRRHGRNNASQPRT